MDARQHLRDAVETFQDLRAANLVARANQELRASGETARKRDPSTLVKFTPTELQIAQLVTSGLSNKEVATQCWISPRTVAFHLRNVFAKAGVTSRRTGPARPGLAEDPGQLTGLSNRHRGLAPTRSTTTPGESEAAMAIHAYPSPSSQPRMITA